MKKILVIIAVIASLAISIVALTACNPINPGNYNLVAPDGAPIAALADMWDEDFGDADITYAITAETNLNAEFAKGTEFIVAPINLGANMHNAAKADATKYDYKLMNVTSWGVLYIVSNETGYEVFDDNAEEFLDQFDGKTVETIGRQAIPGKAVEYLFGDAGASVSLLASDATTLQQKIMSGTSVTAVLGEPAITALKANGATFDVLGSVSDVYNAVTGDDFPMAGLFVRADVAEENSGLVSAINDRIATSVKAFNDDPETVGNKANEAGSTLKGAVLKNAAPKMNVKFKNSADSKSAVTKLLTNIGVAVDDSLFI